MLSLGTAQPITVFFFFFTQKGFFLTTVKCNTVRSMFHLSELEPEIGAIAFGDILDSSCGELVRASCCSSGPLIMATHFSEQRLSAI